MLHCHMRTKRATDKLPYRHHESHNPNNLPSDYEEKQRSNVAREVQRLRVRRSLQQVKPHDRHER